MARPGSWMIELNVDREVQDKYVAMARALGESAFARIGRLVEADFAANRNKAAAKAAAELADQGDLFAPEDAAEHDAEEVGDER